LNFWNNFYYQCSLKAEEPIDSHQILNVGKTNTVPDADLVTTEYNYANGKTYAG
jgi:hypothetical protein